MRADEESAQPALFILALLPRFPLKVLGEAGLLLPSCLRGQIPRSSLQVLIAWWGWHPGRCWVWAGSRCPGKPIKPPAWPYKPVALSPWLKLPRPNAEDYLRLSASREEGLCGLWAFLVDHTARWCLGAASGEVCVLLSVLLRDFSCSQCTPFPVLHSKESCGGGELAQLRSPASPGVSQDTHHLPHGLQAQRVPLHGARSSLVLRDLSLS